MKKGRFFIQLCEPMSLSVAALIDDIRLGGPTPLSLDRIHVTLAKISVKRQASAFDYSLTCNSNMPNGIDLPILSRNTDLDLPHQPSNPPTNKDLARASLLRQNATTAYCKSNT